MKELNHDLHGSAPDQSDTALILIDVINDMDFPEAEQLLRYAVPMAGQIAQLKKRTKVAGIPSIYVNDNFGRWKSDFRRIVDHAIRDGSKGKAVADQLIPESEDYFVLKPKHSGFFSTTLDTLLEYLGVRNVIVTGVAANICVLFTANDAYMRDYALFVPSDCVASNTEEENRYAIEQMSRILKADVRPSPDLDLQALSGKQEPR